MNEVGSISYRLRLSLGTNEKVVNLSLLGFVNQVINHFYQKLKQIYLISLITTSCTSELVSSVLLYTFTKLRSTKLQFSLYFTFMLLTRAM